MELRGKLTVRAQMVTIKKYPFRAEQEADFSWSVIEISTGMAVRVRGAPMVLLTEEKARTLATALNELANVRRTVH